MSHDPKNPIAKPQAWKVKPLRIGGSRKPVDFAATPLKTVVSTQVISDAEQANLKASASQPLPPMEVPLTKAETSTLVNLTPGIESIAATKFGGTVPGPKLSSEAQPAPDPIAPPHTQDYDYGQVNTGDIVVEPSVVAIQQNVTVQLAPKPEEPPFVDLGQREAGATPFDDVQTRVMGVDVLIKNVAATIEPVSRPTSGPNVAEFESEFSKLIAEKQVVAPQAELPVTNPTMQQPPTSGAVWHDPSATGDEKLFGKPITVVPEGDTAAPSAPPPSGVASEAQTVVREIDPALAITPGQESVPEETSTPRRKTDFKSQFGVGDDDFPKPGEIPESDTAFTPRPEEQKKPELAADPALYRAVLHLEEMVSEKFGDISERFDSMSELRMLDEKKFEDAKRLFNAALNEIRDCMKPLERAVTVRQDNRDNELHQYIEKLERSINALGIDATRSTLEGIVSEVGTLKNTVSALQLTVNESRGFVSKTLESQTRAETDIKGLRENQNTSNTQFGELKSKTEATLGEVEKKLADVVKIQKDAYDLASEVKLDTGHIRNDTERFATDVKNHVDGKLSAVLASEKELREKVEALPGLNSDLATTVRDIAASIKALAEEVKKPNPPMQAPPHAQPAPVAAPAQAADPATPPHAPAAPTTPPVTPKPCQPEAETQPRRRNWGLSTAFAAGAAVMLLAVMMHACSGPERYASNDRMVFSKIEGGMVPGQMDVIVQNVNVVIGDVKTALWGIAAQETGNKHNAELVADKNLDDVRFPGPNAIGPALGKYGLMKAYWPEWADKAGVEKEYLDPEKYIERDPKTNEPLRFGVPDEVQQKVAAYHFEDLLKQEKGDYGRAIKRWNSKDPTYLEKVGTWVSKKDGAK